MSSLAKSILDQFEEMADEPTEYFPGSVRPIIRHINRVVPGPERKDPEEWDAKPRVLKVGGVDMELFTIGHLGQALGGRKPVTIRKWERTGIIPKPTFHKPSDDPRGKRRFYSRAQIEGLVQIAAEEGVLDRYAKPITHTNFTPRAIALFRELAAQ